MSEQVEKLAEHIITRSLRNSKRFDSLAKDVDHKVVGEYARRLRLKKEVTAADVAEELKISKTRLSLLESGIRLWDLKTLERYLRSVFRLCGDM